MSSNIVKFFISTLLFGLSTLASAATIPIDIFNVSGVPGTGGSWNIQGPCYCEESAYLSSVMLLQPGTYDFGKVREYWDLSGETPDGGPDQPNYYVLFAPLITSGSYPFDFPSPEYFYPNPVGVQCQLDDDACNSEYSDAYMDFDLTFTVDPGENAVQVELISNYQYTSPLPEPFPSGMFAFGLALIVGISVKLRSKSASTQ